MNLSSLESGHRANHRNNLANDLRELARIAPHTLARELSNGVEHYVVRTAQPDRTLHLDVTPNSEITWRTGSELELLNVLNDRFSRATGLRVGTNGREDQQVHNALAFVVRALLQHAPLVTAHDRLPVEDPDDVIIVVD